MKIKVSNVIRMVVFSTLIASAFYVSLSFVSKLSPESRASGYAKIFPINYEEYYGTEGLNNIPLTQNPDFGKPTKLSLPELKINLAVLDGKYEGGTWELEDDQAHFANMTSLPNQYEGNSIIYGHNNPKVFLNTRNLKPRYKLILETDKNLKLEYEFTNFELLSKNDPKILAHQKEPRLTLLTCNGWQDMYRKMMYFKFVKIVD